MAFAQIIDSPWIVYTAKICNKIAVEIQWNYCDLVLTTLVHCMHCLAALNWRLMTAVTALSWMLFLLWNKYKTYWKMMHFMWNNVKIRNRNIQKLLFLIFKNQVPMITNIVYKLYWIYSHWTVKAKRLPSSVLLHT